MDMDNGVRIDMGVGDVLGGGGQSGKNWDNCNRINKNNKKRKCIKVKTDH